MKKDITIKERNNKYSAKYHENEEGSYRMPLDYSRAGILNETVDSYSILASKGRSKSQYIVEVLTSMGENPRRLTFLDELIYEARKIDVLRLNRGLASAEDYKKFFEDEEALKNLRAAIEPFDVIPAKMTLGFNRNLKYSKEVLNFLANLAPKERVTTISNAILTYIKRGYDLKGLSLLADRDLYEMALAYDKLNSEEREELLDSLEILVTHSVKLLNREDEEEERVSTSEIQKYFG